jgi:hypothetical protein
MYLTKKEKQKIKAKLQSGDIKRIADMIGKSRSTVNRWFKDESNSSEITEAIKNLLQKKANTLENIRKSI